MKFGITGHQHLRDSDGWIWVMEELNHILEPFDADLVGITSLAVGADQLFAKAILDHRGSIYAILPFSKYEFTFKEGEDRNQYFSLLNKANRVEVLSRKSSDEESFFEAGKRVIDLSEIIIAVWDGRAAAGLGGTGDAVKYAKQQKKKIIHLNPGARSIDSGKDFFD